MFQESENKRNNLSSQYSINMASKKTSQKIVTSLGRPVVILLIAALVILILFAILNASAVYVRKDGEKNETFSDKGSFQIIYTYSKSCPHCIKFNDTFDLVAKSFAQNVTTHDTEIIKVEREHISKEYMPHVDGFPTVLVYVNDKYKTKAVGNMSSQEFGKFLEDSLQE